MIHWWVSRDHPPWWTYFLRWKTARDWNFLHDVKGQIFHQPGQYWDSPKMSSFWSKCEQTRHSIVTQKCGSSFLSRILQCETETDVVLFEKISNIICKVQSEVWIKRSTTSWEENSNIKVVRRKASKRNILKFWLLSLSIPCLEPLRW